MRPASALCAAAVCAVAVSAHAVGVSGEAQLAPGPTRLRPFYGQPAAVTWDGAHYLALVSDNREQVLETFAYRLTSTGQSLDGPGVALGPAKNTMETPAIACDGAGMCLFAWFQAADLQPHVRAQRFAVDGGVLDPTPILLPALLGYAAVRVASGPTDFLVSWLDLKPDGGNGMLAARVSKAGAVLDPVPVWLDTDNATDGVLTWDGSAFLLLWQDFSYNLLAARYDGALNPLGAPVQVTSAGNPLVRLGNITTRGGLSLAVYEDDRRNPTTHFREVWGTRFDSSGAVLDPNGFLVSPCTQNCSAPRAAIGPAGFAVTWLQYNGSGNDVYVGRVPLDGGPATRALAPAQLGTYTPPAVACSPTDCRALYPGTTSVLSIGVDSTSGALDAGSDFTPPLMRSMNEQHPSVACAGDTCLVVWAAFDDGTGEGYDFAVRARPDGGILDAAPLLVMNNGYSPSVVAGSGEFLVYDRLDALTGGTGSAIRVGANGAVLDPVPLSVGGLVFAISGTFDGAAFRLAWRGAGGSLSTTLVAVDGGFLPPGPQLACSACMGDIEPIYLASLPDVTMATFYDLSPMTGMAVLRFAPGGGALTGARQPLAFYHPSGIVAAPAAEQFLVMGVAEHIDGGAFVGAMRVASDGGALDPEAFELPTLITQQLLSAGFDGTDYLLLLETGVASSDVVGVRVTPQGTFDGPPFDIAAGPLHERSSAIAMTPNGAVVVYSRFDPTPGVQAMRIGLRLLGERPLGSPCSLPHECDSNACSGGVCTVGPAPDAGAPDAGTPDAGTSGGDAGLATESDGGLDGGRDGGPQSGGYAVGCGCSALPGFFSWLLWLSPVFVRRRRRTCVASRSRGEVARP